MYFAIYSCIISSMQAGIFNLIYLVNYIVMTTSLFSLVLSSVHIPSFHHHHHHHQSIIAKLVSVHNSIGNMCQSEGRYDKAYHTSLDILRECLSADHPIIASIHNNRRVVLSQQQEYNSSKQA